MRFDESRVHPRRCDLRPLHQRSKKRNVVPEAETAVETLFGAFLEAVVVESVADAKRLSAWLKENDIGRTAMIIFFAGIEIAFANANRLTIEIKKKQGLF